MACTVGIITLTGDAPHNGENASQTVMENIACYFRETVECLGDLLQEKDLILGPGDTASFRKGRVATVSLIEEARILHINAGPNGDYRRLRYARHINETNQFTILDVHYDTSYWYCGILFSRQRSS